MSAAMEVTVDVRLSPAQIADAFWNMNSDEQADFFAELAGIAGWRLCVQMAHVVYTISERAQRGDYTAQHGLRTMLAHAQDYHESVADMGQWDAQRMLRGMADSAKAHVDAILEVHQ